MRNVVSTSDIPDGMQGNGAGDDEQVRLYRTYSGACNTTRESIGNEYCRNGIKTNKNINNVNTKDNTNIENDIKMKHRRKQLVSQEANPSYLNIFFTIVVCFKISIGVRFLTWLVVNTYWSQFTFIV